MKTKPDKRIVWKVIGFDATFGEWRLEVLRESRNRWSAEGYNGETDDFLEGLCKRRFRTPEDAMIALEKAARKAKK